MERSMSSYTDFTESSGQYPAAETFQLYPSSGSPQAFTPIEPNVDVTGELGDFAGLELLEGAQGLGHDGQWNAGAPLGDYQLPPPQFAMAPDTSYTDAFENSFPLQPFHHPTAVLNQWHDTSHGHGPPGDYKPGNPAPTPADYSYMQPRANGFGTDEGSSSQPGTGLISPQAIFPPAFANPTEYYEHYPTAQSFYNPHPTQFYNGQQYPPAMYPQPLIAPNLIPGPMSTYNHLPPADLQQSSLPLSRANSMSSVDKIRTKTCLTAEDKQKIFQMSKQPNMRQQDIAAKFGIDRSTVSKIISGTKKTEMLRRNGQEEKSVPKQSKSGIPRYPELDIAVGKLVDARAAKGLTTSPDELHALGLEVGAKLGQKDFKGSIKWADNFWKRRAMEGKVAPVKSTTPPSPQDLTPARSMPLAPAHVAPIDKAVPISKSFSTTSLSELAGPSHARQRSQSSPQKAGLLSTHQQPLPIQQSSLAPRPSLTRSHSMGMSSRAGRGHRSRASIASPSLGRSAFHLETSLAPVQEDGVISSRIKHAHSRSDALGLGPWANMPSSMMAHTPYYPMPLYAPSHPPPDLSDFQPLDDAGPSGSKRARR